jgi:hypothetical protein
MRTQLLERPEEFKQLLDGFGQLKSDYMHFTFMGAAHTETFLELIVLQFLQKGTLPKRVPIRFQIA